MHETTDENVEVDVRVNIDFVTHITQLVSASVPLVSNNHSIAQDRPRRDIVLPHGYRDTDSMAHYDLIVAQETSVAFEPSSYLEVISCDNSSKCLVAMNDEFESLQKNSTWKLVELPEGKKTFKVQVDL
ncbi:Retrovirus-related Pol polyprotein from transposon TNT 1-94 [Zea mays]|uniref:Retrovirus-related Pol polyprotein from transposon TNT 1-94 n=1 Tax=Zea mays TaxID=4577 RepID=A0A3L6DUL5_MAIZE|nr:Retrovirus-related Pol polyprotein from transposon TNT 1-94 [Zea mays]